MNRRILTDNVSERALFVLTAVVGLLVIVMAAALAVKAAPILRTASVFSLLLDSDWKPSQGKFGFYPFLMGTVWVTVAALALSVPVSLFSSVYLAEFAGRRFRGVAKPVIDVLAGIPSVVYGLWGVLWAVPFIKDYIAPAAQQHHIPLLSSSNTSGFGILAGGVVLGIMVFPLIISVTTEVLQAVPEEFREAARSLGATRWEIARRVVLRKAFPGVCAAVILGFSRAFGETMAVMMVVGNVVQAPRALLDAAYPLPALIANNYGEMMSVPLYDAALMFAALLLLLVVLFFNLSARLILSRHVKEAHP